MPTLRVEHLTGAVYAVRTVPENHCLAVVGGVDAATAGENERYAKLFAAAPELLAELESNRITLARLCMAVLQLDHLTAEEIARDVEIDFKSGEPKVFSPAIAAAKVQP